MRAACRAAGELASLFFFNGCAVTRQQYPESFGAECAAQCLHRPARPLRPFAVVYGGPRVVGGVPQGVADRPSYVVGLGVGVGVGVGVPLSPSASASASASAFRCRPRPRPSARTLGPPCGREFRPIRTRWREIFAEIAGFPPSASQTTVSRSHPESLGSSHRHPDAVGPPCAPSPVPQSLSAVPRSPSALRAGGSFGRSAPDGGRFPLKLQFSLLRRRQVKATAGGVRSAVPRSKAPASAVQGHH